MGEAREDPDAWRDAFRQFGSVVCLSTADWDTALWTNKQHVMSRLGSVLPVVFVESLGMRRPRLVAADVQRMARRASKVAGHSRAPVTPRPEHLSVVSPVVVPWHGSRRIRRLNRVLLEHQLCGSLQDLPRPRLLWTYTPLAVDVLDLSRFEAVVYHAVDDLATVPRVPGDLVVELERRLVPVVDVVFATTAALVRRVEAFGGHAVLVGNVADHAHFVSAREAGPLPPDLAGISEPRVTFIGALSDHKVDWALLGAVADELTDHQFVLIGPQGAEETMIGARALLRRCPNVHVLGYRGYAELPAYLRGSAAAIVPYRLTRHTEAVFPMKVFEYLAAGVPVVATRLPALELAPDLPVDLASDAPHFAAAIRRADRSDSASRRRSAYAARHTWDRLLTRMAVELLSAQRTGAAQR